MKRIFLQKNTLRREGGYTLLFAILVSSLVLAIGLSILNINKKELLLTAGARDSAAAFYAADGGLECAMHADDKGAFDPLNPGDPTAKIIENCNTGHPQNIRMISYPAGAFNPAIYQFEARFGEAGTSCAIIQVDKSQKRADGTTKTIIDSKGYNTGWGTDTTVQPRVTGCILRSTKKVERAIEYTF